jgi:hypothetical protein
MTRERLLKVGLVLVGLHFKAGIYPLTTFISTPEGAPLKLRLGGDFLPPYNPPGH